MTESFKSPACNTRMGCVPGDPKEARAHAANCRQLAETASSPTVQKTFADLANQWNRLANELDDAYALLNALNELDLKSSSEADHRFQTKAIPRCRRRIELRCGCCGSYAKGTDRSRRPLEP